MKFTFSGLTLTSISTICAAMLLGTKVCLRVCTCMHVCIHGCMCVYDRIHSIRRTGTRQEC